jgi:hypothetical protein
MGWLGLNFEIKALDEIQQRIGFCFHTPNQTEGSSLEILQIHIYEPSLTKVVYILVFNGLICMVPRWSYNMYYALMLFSQILC